MALVCNKKSPQYLGRQTAQNWLRVPRGRSPGAPIYESRRCRSIGGNRAEGPDSQKMEFNLRYARCFPPNNVVALDDRCHSAQIAGIILLAIDAHHTAMSPHKDFRSASDLRGQSQSEINFGPSR